MRAAQELARKIRKKKIGSDGTFTIREVYRHGWTLLDTPEAVTVAAEVLEDAGWIRRTQEDRGVTGGHPSGKYLVNPKLFKEE
jgi:putative DNA primase/helicase